RSAPCGTALQRTWCREIPSATRKNPEDYHQVAGAVSTANPDDLTRNSLELIFVGRAFTARQAPREGAPYINSSELQFKAAGRQIFLLKPGGVEGQGCVEFLVLRSAIIRL